MDETVTVSVTPAQARHIAASIRVELATQWGETWAAAFPDREDLRRMRALIDACTDELDMLDWGEPQCDVALVGSRDRLTSLAQDMLQGGEERIENPIGWNTDDVPTVRRDGIEMISAAEAINVALAEHRSFATVS